MSIVRRLLSSAAGFFSSDDGLDITDYIRALETRFEITIGVEDLVDVYTLSDMTACIARKRRELGRPLGEEIIGSLVRQITSDQMGVRETELHEKTRFFEDLCC